MTPPVPARRSGWPTHAMPSQANAGAVAAEITHEFGPWKVACRADDGGRISRLAWRGTELLTAAPVRFTPPHADYGRYELRPVYAYDDCWPSVAACRYPGTSGSVPDHGELCWLPWQFTHTATTLVCRVDSAALPVSFARTLDFRADRVTWRFRIENHGDTPLPCLHVMHPLLPLTAMRALELPAFTSAVDATRACVRPETSEAAIAAFLLDRPRGTATMLFLQGVREGRCAFVRHDGLRLDMQFPADRFPTLGIWWNHLGYPDEDGCRRDECAFEPVSAQNSNLADATQSGAGIRLEPGERFEWECEWRVSPATPIRCHT